jgi:hypothetical protein
VGFPVPDIYSHVQWHTMMGQACQSAMASHRLGALTCNARCEEHMLIVVTLASPVMQPGLIDET